MALVEGCKHLLEITVPQSAVREETDRVVEDIRKKVRLPGFRPGKVPSNLVRSKFQQDVKQEVLEKLLPRFFREGAEKEGLVPVGQPNVTDVHFHDNEDLHFKVEFEVAPTFELGQYRDLEVPYKEPVVADSDIDQRIETLREQKAEYINIDPRPAEDGDHAVVALKSIEGVDGPPIEQESLTLHLGDSNTMPVFTEQLRGASPGDEREFEVTYPEDYGEARLGGKTVKFHATLKALRKKELPEVNDDFAKDLGDYQNLGELRDAIRRSIFSEREYRAQQDAKSKLLDQLVDAHDFPVPQAYVDRQIEINVENRLRGLAAQGIDPRTLKLDWDKVRESQKDRALRDVKASLIIEKVADTENIQATNEEVDGELQRIAKQEREPIAAVRKRLQENGTLGRIASHFRTEKTLGLIFERARKVEPPPEPEPAATEETPAAE